LKPTTWANLENLLPRKLFWT